MAGPAHYNSKLSKNIYFEEDTYFFIMDNLQGNQFQR